jgi:hypothetical protein
MRQWSVSLAQTFPLLCVPQRGLMILLQSDIGYVSMPQTSRLWPSPTPRSSSRSPNAPSTGPTEPNRRTLCSSIHHVILTAIEPPFTRGIHGLRSFIVCVAGCERATVKNLFFLPIPPHIEPSRIRTAFACACSPSQSASVATIGPSVLRPSAVSSCEVMCFWKESVFTPLN